MSDSAGTLWLDVGKRDWSDALLEKCGLSRAAMPALVEGCEVSALLEPAVAQRWGLNPSVIVAGGGGDNAVSAIGLGPFRRAMRLFRWAPPACCLWSQMPTVRRPSLPCTRSVTCCQTCGIR